MDKICGCYRMDCNENQYNDQHQNFQVAVYRKQYIDTILKLQKRMRVWCLIIEEDE